MLTRKTKPFELGQLERLILRARRHYEREGYTRLWIDQRMRSVSARHELTSEWYRRGVRDSEQFRALLISGKQLPIAVPELIAYLEHYPRSRPAGVEDFIYWSVADFGLKPTLRVNHVITYPLAARPSGVSHVIAIKQLYASHYFHTALELRFLADDRRADRGGFYLLSIIRSRIDGTTGLKGSLLRPVISRRSRTAVRGYLEHLKRQVERADPALRARIGRRRIRLSDDQRRRL